MTLRDATPRDHAAIRALLNEQGLPVQDLDSATIAFIVATDGDRLAGVVGLESVGDVALLRSLAVASDHRRTGTGSRLVHAAETLARTRGLDALVLLTQTAERFFLQHGYRRIDRGQAPPSVQLSAEFRSLCPASAICMLKPMEFPRTHTVTRYFFSARRTPPAARWPKPCSMRWRRGACVPSAPAVIPL